MKSMMVCFAVGLTFATATLYSACSHAEELPVESVCHIQAEYAYDMAVSAGDGLPDGAYEREMGECEWDEDFGAGVPLNELVVVDGEKVEP